jgi:hypothetical protein
MPSSPLIPKKTGATEYRWRAATRPAARWEGHTESPAPGLTPRPGPARPLPCSKGSVSRSSCSFSIRSLDTANSSGPLTCNWAADPAWRSRKVRKGPPRANSSSSGGPLLLMNRRAGPPALRAHRQRAAPHRSRHRISRTRTALRTRAGSSGENRSRDTTRRFRANPAPPRAQAGF